LVSSGFSLSICGEKDVHDYFLNFACIALTL